MNDVQEHKTRGRPRKIVEDETDNDRRQRIRSYTQRYQEKNYHKLKINALDKRIDNLVIKMNNLLEQRDNLKNEWDMIIENTKE